MQYNRNPVDHYKLDARTLKSKYHKEMYSKLLEDDRQVIDLNFGYTPKKLKKGNIWMYMKVWNKIIVYNQV